MTNPLPKPPPCPPDPWPMIGKAWQEMEAFRKMTWDVMVDLMMTDPRFSTLMQNFISRALVTDPTITNLLQTTINQTLANIKGVTDGSNAALGQIGEFITFDVSNPFNGYPNINDDTIPLAMIPAGDWDLRMNMDTTSQLAAGGVPIRVGSFSSWLTPPTPPGLSNSLTMVQSLFTASGAPAEALIALNSCVARASFAEPTQLMIRIVVDQSSDPVLLGGFSLMHLEGRRMR